MNDANICKRQEMKTITKKEWQQLPSGYKSIMHGERYMLTYDNGTCLAPVNVKGMKKPSKKIHRHY